MRPVGSIVDGLLRDDPINKGLLAYWPLGALRVSGGKILDIGPNRINGTITGSPVPVAGKVGGALKFTGSSQYVNLGTPSAIPASPPITISAWVLCPHAGNDTVILAKWDGLTNTYNWLLSTDDWNIQGGSSFIYRAHPSAPAAGWRHIAATMDASNNGYLYQDGVPTTATNQGWQNFGGTGASIMLAARNGAGTADLYSSLGGIQELRIWNRALSGAEIRRLFKQTQPWAGTAPPYITWSPKVTASGATTFAPGAGADTIAGQTPTLKVGVTKAPGAGADTIAGQTPTLKVGVTKAPGAGAIADAGQTPTLTAGMTKAPGAGAVTVGGQTPSIGNNTTFAPGAGADTIGGQTPTLVITGPVTFAPGAGRFTIQGGTPVLTGAVPIVTGGPGDGDTPADIARRRWLEWLASRKRGATSPVPPEPPPTAVAPPQTAKRAPRAAPPAPKQDLPPLLVSNLAAVRAQADAMAAREAQRAAAREVAEKVAAEVRRRRDEDDDDVLSFLL